MAHKEAEKTMAVDRYLLNELTQEERLRFEEHYFECGDCADAVEAGQIFISGIRPIPEPVPWWRRLVELVNAPIAVPAWRMWILGGAAGRVFGSCGFSGSGPPAVLADAGLANTVLLAGETVKGPDEDKTYSLPKLLPPPWK